MSVSLNAKAEVKQEWIDNDYWVQPDPTKVKIRQEFLDEYWWWIHERQNIWYKRVILEQPAPWTDDPILREYKFTNAIRDLDRLTIYYIDNLLSKLEDNEQSKKNLIYNTMVYRLFCRIDTWEEIGYLDLFNDFETQLERAKANLRKRREEGHPMFTNAYYVNDLKAANPNPETNSNKTENAICLMEMWAEDIDRIYQKGFVEAKNMEEQLVFFQTLTCVGDFTAYEWACDFCLAERYRGIKLVNWDDDSFTNVGPGAKRGLNWIFEDLGNMTHLQALFWLRSIAKSEFERLGYDKTMKWPEKVKDFNLRIIEQSACELQKYWKAKYGKGRPKMKFKPQTTDVSYLKDR